MSAGDAERAREIVQGCTHRRVHAGGDGYSAPAYVEDFDGACRGCITAAFAAQAAQTRALRDAAELVLNSERDDDGEGSWYCVLASDMAELRAALTGAPREPADG